MFEEVNSVVFDGAIIERTNGDYGELGAGFLFEFGAESFKALASFAGNHSGKIGNVTLRDDFRNVVCKCGSNRHEDE